MGGGIILNYIKIYFKAINDYCTFYSHAIAVISVVIAIIGLYSPINNFIVSNFFCLLIFLILFVAIHFFNWKNNNFNSLNFDFDSSIIIGGENDNHLSFNISKLIVPSEDALLLTLKLEFDEVIKSSLLKKNFYTLIFKKPNDLEINFKNNTKIQYAIADDGLESPFYCIIVENKNNSIDNLLFELQAGNEMKGNLEIYFLIGNFEEDFKEKISKKSPVFNERVCSREIEIDGGGCIIIDRRV